MIPKDTPTPIPAFSPVDRLSDDGAGEVCTVEDVGDMLNTVELEDGVFVGIATFHPKAAIAPTVEGVVNVVVTIVQAVDSVGGVDAYVNVIPGSTVDKQSPTAWPDWPWAR